MAEYTQAYPLRKTIVGPDSVDPTRFYEANVNSDGSTNTRLTGRNVKDAFSGSSTVTKTYGASMKGFSITNDDSATSLTFMIGTITITVRASETFDGEFDSFTSVTVTTTVPFRAVVRG